MFLKGKRAHYTCKLPCSTVGISKHRSYNVIYDCITQGLIASSKYVKYSRQNPLSLHQEFWEEPKPAQTVLQKQSKPRRERLPDRCLDSEWWKWHSLLLWFGSFWIIETLRKKGNHTWNTLGYYGLFWVVEEFIQVIFTENLFALIWCYHIYLPLQVPQQHLNKTRSSRQLYTRLSKTLKTCSKSPRGLNDLIRHTKTFFPCWTGRSSYSKYFRLNVFFCRCA